MIVVIEDDKDLLELYRWEVAEKTECRAFLCPFEALQYIKENSKDIARFITDQNMLPLKGTEIIKALNVFGYDIKTVLLTGMEDENVSLDLINFQNQIKIKNKTIFFEKPYPIEKIVESILK